VPEKKGVTVGIGKREGKEFLPCSRPFRSNREGGCCRRDSGRRGKGKKDAVPPVFFVEERGGRPPPYFAGKRMHRELTVARRTVVPSELQKGERRRIVGVAVRA